MKPRKTSEEVDNARDLTLLAIKIIREPKILIDMKDLVMLVKFALKHEEITLSRAAELTGLSLSLVKNLLKEEKDG